MGGSILYGILLPNLKMRVIIFNDTQNFNGSLNLINDRFKNKDKRFWNYNKYMPFLLKKINSLKGFNNIKLQLVKAYFYEGRYSSTIMKNFRWSTGQEIREINRLILKEQALLNMISQQSNVSKKLRREVTKHVEGFKKELMEKREAYIKNIEKQERNFEGQKELFKEIEKNPLTEIRATPLKQSKGEVYQKGVDVLLATDLVHLAHTGAFDIAIILSGDTDLIEAVKLIKGLGKTVIVLSYHDPSNPEKSNISDLIGVGKFVNLRGLKDGEIKEMSDLREKRD